MVTLLVLGLEGNLIPWFGKQVFCAVNRVGLNIILVWPYNGFTFQSSFSKEVAIMIKIPRPRVFGRE